MPRPSSSSSFSSSSSGAAGIEPDAEDVAYVERRMQAFFDTANREADKWKLVYRGVVPTEVLFLELCSMSGTLSQTALDRGMCRERITIDCDERSNATYVMDLSDPVQVQDLGRDLERYIARGYAIVAHASMPCEAWSRANGSPKSEKRIRALEIANSCIAVMRQYAMFWSYENPDTGVLPQFLGQYESLSTLRAHVDYCQYGYTCLKPTFLAFSMPEVVDTYFFPRMCPGRVAGKVCPMTRLNQDTKRYNHIGGYKDQPQNGAVFPKRLCDDLVRCAQEVLAVLLDSMRRTS